MRTAKDGRTHPPAESGWISVREISASEAEQERTEAGQELADEVEYRAATAILPELDEIDNR